MCGTLGRNRMCNFRKWPGLKSRMGMNSSFYPLRYSIHPPFSTQQKCFAHSRFPILFYFERCRSLNMFEKLDWTVWTIVLSILKYTYLLRQFYLKNQRGTTPSCIANLGLKRKKKLLGVDFFDCIVTGIIAWDRS